MPLAVWMEEAPWGSAEPDEVPGSGAYRRVKHCSDLVYAVENPAEPAGRLWRALQSLQR